MMSPLLKANGGLRSLCCCSSSTLQDVQAFWSACPGAKHIPRRLYGQLAAAQEFIQSSLRSIGEFASVREEGSAKQQNELTKVTCFEKKTCIDDDVSHPQRKASSECHSNRLTDFFIKSFNGTSMTGSEMKHGATGLQVASTSMQSFEEATSEWELESKPKQSSNSLGKSIKVAVDGEFPTKELDNQIVVKKASNVLATEGLRSKTDESTVEIDEKLTSFSVVDPLIDKANKDSRRKILGSHNVLPECVGKQQITSVDGGTISDISTTKNSAKILQRKCTSTSLKCSFDTMDKPRVRQQEENKALDDFSDLNVPHGSGCSSGSNSVAPAKPFITAASKHAAADSSGNLDKTSTMQEESDASLKAHGGTLPVGLSEKQDPSSEDPLYADGVANLGYIVCVKNLPASIPLLKVRSQISSHGEVVSSSKKLTAVGCCDCYFEFKTESAMSMALKAQNLRLDKSTFPIRLHKPMGVVVRIGGVSPHTTENEILSTCKQFGALNNIRRCTSGVYDVYYHAIEQQNILKIVHSLQAVTLNNRKWMCATVPYWNHVLTKTAPQEVQKAVQMEKTLDKLKKGVHSALLSLQDLKALISMQEASEDLRK